MSNILDPHFLSFLQHHVLCLFFPVSKCRVSQCNCFIWIGDCIFKWFNFKFLLIILIVTFVIETVIILQLLIFKHYTSTVLVYYLSFSWQIFVPPLSVISYFVWNTKTYLWTSSSCYFSVASSVYSSSNVSVLNPTARFFTAN